MYKGQLQWELGTYDIIIRDDLDTMHFQIDEYRFELNAFDDLELENYKQLPPETRKKLTVEEVSCGHNDFVYELKNYIIQVDIPIKVIALLDREESGATLNVKVRMNDDVDINRNHQFELSIDQDVFVCESDCFELGLDSLRDQIGERYVMKTCHGCAYGDYSVYGANTFGTMMCYKNKKEAYRQVKTKADYMSLGECDKGVQETYVCDEFEPREKGMGYRG